MNETTSCHTLLLNFKSIVEVVTKFTTLPYGAFERIRSAIFAILFHGFKQIDANLLDQFWQLLVRINSSSRQNRQLFEEIYYPDNLRLTLDQWVDQSLANQCLAEQLIFLTNQIDILEEFYQSDAFIRQSDFFQALIICIHSIESNDPSLLANIDPNLSVIDVGCPRTMETNDFIGRSYSSIIPSTRKESRNESIQDDHDNPDLLRRRINSDPIHQREIKSPYSTEFSSSYLLADIQSNYSYSIDDNSSCDIHADDSISNDSKPVDKDDEQDIQPINIIQSSSPSSSFLSPPRLPHSSLLWPKQGQTLDNYIREYDSQTLTDVEKDNAHFYLSEAILTAIEYIKFSEQCRNYFHPTIEDLTAMHTSVNQFDENVNYSNELSAERIALSIMATWKNYQIPTASDLFWMIPHERNPSDELTSDSEQPIVDENDELSNNDTNKKISQRGTPLWAPLREQIIFHIHQPISRDMQLKEQNNLCSGCGRAVEKGYPHRFRYCEYTGKYFCRTCHTDQRFYLPSYIINKWDFSNRHIISNFAYEYLNRIFVEPIFNLYDLNPKLFERSKKLRAMNELRWALYSIRLYIFACRIAEEQGSQQFLLTIPSYIYEQPHVYSLQDLVKLKLGELQKLYEPMFNRLRNHVHSCTLCFARGFICEICNNSSKIIFPFDIQNTSVCPVCQSCFHHQCHKTYKYICPKCQRNQHRTTLSSP